jgi:competence protein ComEA
VNQHGRITKSERLLLGMTAIFLCGLMALFCYDRSRSLAAPVHVETERAVTQEEVLGDLVPVRLNTATEDELTALPGIGEALAHRIVEYREENGPFDTIEEIMEVSGIGEGKFAEIRERITVEETT